MKNRNLPHSYLKNFILCGITGFCIEILFTGISSLLRRDYSLKGTSSLWMFPIYGSACIIEPLYRVLKKTNVILRGLFYMFLIFLVEFLSGTLLSSHEHCPWNYHRSRYHYKEVIRLDFAPWWFLTGLLYESLLRHGFFFSFHKPINDNQVRNP